MMLRLSISLFVLFTAVGLAAAGGGNQGPYDYTGETIPFAAQDCYNTYLPNGEDLRPIPWTSGNLQRPDKIWICHGTASDVRPYVLINVDPSAIAGHIENARHNDPTKPKRADRWPGDIVGLTTGDLLDMAAGGVAITCACDTPDTVFYDQCDNSGWKFMVCDSAAYKCHDGVCSQFDSEDAEWRPISDLTLSMDLDSGCGNIYTDDYFPTLGLFTSYGHWQYNSVEYLTRVTGANSHQTYRWCCSTCEDENVVQD